MSGFVFAFVQQKLVWDSLGSHLSPMQCSFFSSFIKFKIGPIPGGGEEGRGKKEIQKGCFQLMCSATDVRGELFFSLSVKHCDIGRVGLVVKFLY